MVLVENEWAYSNRRVEDLPSRTWNNGYKEQEGRCLTLLSNCEFTVTNFCAVGADWRSIQ